MEIGQLAAPVDVAELGNLAGEPLVLPSCRFQASSECWLTPSRCETSASG